MSLLEPSHGFLPAARLKVDSWTSQAAVVQTSDFSFQTHIQTLAILATTEGYCAPVNEETRRLYRYSHVLEAGKPVTLRVMDGAVAAAAGNFTYDWRVRQHDGVELLRCVRRWNGRSRSRGLSVSNP